MSHELRTVAYAENGYPQLEYALIDRGRALAVHALRTSREYYTLGAELLYHIERDLPVWHYLAVYIAFAHPAGDKLIILPAEINYQHILMTVLTH